MSDDAQTVLLSSLSGSLGLSPDAVLTGPATLASVYPVSELAAASVATAGVALAELLDALGLGRPAVTVRRELADAWFGIALRPIGWTLPSPWDPIAGD